MKNFLVRVMAKGLRQGKNGTIKNVFCLLCLFVLPLMLLAIVVYSKSKHEDPSVRTDAKSESLLGGPPNSVYLLVLIMSDPANSATRQVIRETWLSTVHQRVKHLFVVGSKGLKKEVLEGIAEEDATYGDVMILNLISESYSSLTTKVLAGLKFAKSNYSFNFLLKCDDDSFVRIPQLVEALEKQPQNHLYWGFFKGGSIVFQKGKWKETNWFLCDSYLPYALGGGYVLSADLVDHLAKNSDLLQHYKSEDVSVGVWLSPLKIHRVHDVRFDTEFESRGCYNNYLITHKQSANDMRAKHTHLLSTGKLCQTELRTRYSYNYNWTVPPSQCCKTYDPTLP